MGCLLLDIYLESTGLKLSVKRLSQGNAQVLMIISYYRNIVFLNTVTITRTSKQNTSLYFKDVIPIGIPLAKQQTNKNQKQNKTKQNKAQPPPRKKNPKD